MRALSPKKISRRPFEGLCIEKDYRKLFEGPCIKRLPGGYLRALASKKISVGHTGDAMVLDQNDKRAIKRGPASSGSMRRPFREGPVRNQMTKSQYMGTKIKD